MDTPPRRRGVGFAPKPEVVVTFRSPPTAVFARDANGRPLAPMSPGRARQLIGDGKAHLLEHPSFPILAFASAVHHRSRDPLLLGLALAQEAVTFALLYRDVSGARVAAHIHLPLVPASDLASEQQQADHAEPYVLYRGQQSLLSAFDLPNWPHLHATLPLIEHITTALHELAPISHVSVVTMSGTAAISAPQRQHHPPQAIPRQSTPVVAQRSGAAVQALQEQFLRLTRRLRQARPTHIAALLKQMSAEDGRQHDLTAATAAPPYLYLPAPTHTTEAVGRLCSFRMVDGAANGATLVRGVVAQQSPTDVALLVPIAGSGALGIRWQSFRAERTAVTTWFDRSDLVLVPVVQQRMRAT